MSDHLELMRDVGKEFPTIQEPELYRSARIWHCKYRSLQPLRLFAGLVKLEIATFPDASLEVLSPIRGLQLLHIVHLPGVSSLEPLAALVKLRKVSLETLPSWDSSNRVTTVESLRPLASLPALEELELFGVVPVSKDIGELFESKSLKRVSISKYPKVQERRLRERFAA